MISIRAQQKDTMTPPFHIYYFSPFDILKPRTNQIAAIHLCEGFSENACHVKLIVPCVFRKGNLPRANILRSYGVARNIDILHLPTPFKGDNDGFLKRLLIVSLDLIIYLGLAVSHQRSCFVLSSAESILWPMAVFKRYLGLGKAIHIVPWLHEIKLSKMKSWLLKNADLIMCTNSAIKDDLVRSLSLESRKIFVTLNPISEARRKDTVSKPAARKSIGYNLDRPLVVYTGKLFKGQREIEYILEAAELLPEAMFLFTGGQETVLNHYHAFCASRKINNCLFPGYLPNYEKVRDFQFAADILLSYYSPEEHDVRYNLPNKLCEYMITGNPIIMPDYPATRDVVNEKSVVFVEAENPTKLAKAIFDVIADYPSFSKKAHQAFQDVQTMTYKIRAKLIMDFFSESMTA